jgi:hypothetical protein
MLWETEAKVVVEERNGNMVSPTYPRGIPPTRFIHSGYVILGEALTARVGIQVEQAIRPRNERLLHILHTRQILQRPPWQAN